MGNAPEERSIPDEHRHRIRRNPGPGQTVCPYSGCIASDDEFVHFDDLDAVKKQVAWNAEQDVLDYVEAMAQDFNRSQPAGGFISMRMDLKRSQRPEPLAIREDLLRDLECTICRRSYGVYAIALFCPDCGAPNLALHFRREVQLVREQITLADQQDEHAHRELAYRLMGNAHEDVLTAFETALKTVFRCLIRQDRPHQTSDLLSKKIIFQNIERIRECFVKLGIDPFSALAAGDLQFLNTNIQKRHVIGHNLGMADEHYSQLTQTEQPGETVQLLGNEIGRFAEVCMAVVAGLEDWLLPNALSPSTSPSS